MKKANKKNHFYKEYHKPVEKYGLHAKPLKKKPEVSKVGIYELITVPKENIGIDEEYQRILKHKQISNIKSTWDDEICDLPNFFVHEEKETGEVFIQLTDGQHRSCANPHKEITGRKVNTLSPVQRCLQANNPKTKSNWDVNARFWGLFVELGRIGSVDENQIQAIVKTFKSLGYNPVDRTKHKVTDISGNIAKFHSTILNVIQRELNKRIGLRDAEKREMSAQVMDDVVNIIHEVFNDEINSIPENRIKLQWGKQIWCAVTQFLLDSRKGFGLGGEYDRDEIIEVMRRGEWRMGGYSNKSAKAILKTTEDYEDIAEKYRAKKIKGVSTRYADCWQRIIFDMHKYYKGKRK